MKSSLIILSIYLFMLSVAHSQHNYGLGQSAQKILSLDLGVSDEEIKNLYLGVYVDEQYIDTFLNADTSFNLEQPFKVGSVSKFITAMQLHTEMNHDENISMDSKIASLLNLKNKSLQSISIGDLLSHQSGLPLQINLYSINAAGQIKETLSEKQIKKYMELIPYDPAFTHFYNHTNYALLGMILSDIKNSHTQVLPFNYSSTMQLPLKDLIREVKKCTVLDDAHPIFNPVNKLVNVEGFYASYGLLAQKVKREKYLFTLTGRVDSYSTTIAFFPETDTSVIIASKNHLSKYVDLCILVLRMINHNWRKI